MRIAGYLYLEDFSTSGLKFLYILVPIAVLSSYTGKHLLSRIPVKYFEALVLLFIFTLGVYGLIS